MLCLVLPSRSSSSTFSPFRVDRPPHSRRRQRLGVPWSITLRLHSPRGRHRLASFQSITLPHHSTMRATHTRCNTLVGCQPHFFLTGKQPSPSYWGLHPPSSILLCASRPSRVFIPGFTTRVPASPIELCILFAASAAFHTHSSLLHTLVLTGCSCGDWN